MDLVSAAEILSSMDHSMVVLDSSRCLHSLCKYSQCEACYTICPLGAIQPGTPPTLDSKACQTCLACLPVCPSGAYVADDAVTSMINCVARLEARKVEIICKRNPNPSLSVPEFEAAIQVRGCLAGLGAGGYLALVALGIDQVTARLEACPQCEWGALRPRIEEQIETASQFLQPWQLGAAVAGATQGDLIEQHERPVYDANNPPLSRRDFFRLASRESRMAAARAINREEQHLSQRKPSKDRRRIVAALQHLPAASVADPQASFEDLGFGKIEVSEACTACGVCSTVCPTGSIEFRKEESDFALQYSPAFCIACGLCLDVCAYDAMTLEQPSTYESIFGSGEKIILQQGKLTHCEHCSAAMAYRPGVKYCPICEFRRSNPLSARLPPGFKKGRIQR